MYLLNPTLTLTHTQTEHFATERDIITLLLISYYTNVYRDLSEGKGFGMKGLNITNNKALKKSNKKC